MADGAQQSATSGYQPLSSATATLTSMPLLDIPRWSIPSAIGFSKISTPPHSMRRCITSLTWCRPTPLGGTQDAFTRRGFGANRDGSIMTNGLRRPCCRAALTPPPNGVEVPKGARPRRCTVSLDPGGLDQRHH
ncbi:hypothetical protein LNQ52_22715 [Klebsiella pneumoniae subsp. pneumoniae]|nr:hypothetical protein [Klebsiella pneumoniae subsp. pneumoniae]